MRSRARFHSPQCLKWLIVMMILLTGAGLAAAESLQTKKGVPARLAANYVHAVIEAGRTAYSQHIVDRLHQSLQATENWEEDATLLLPAQFLKLSADETNSKGIGMRYRLISVWPLNPDALPKTETEKSGLLEVIRNPQKPFTWVVQKKGIWYYQAIYPDKAVSESCVACHNNHPKSPKTDYKLGDVMGGIVIDMPLGSRFQKKPDESILIPPEVVADYVHAVLESDRTVYSKYVVQRLEGVKLVETRQDWQKRQGLMLPAQFLKKVSEITARQNLGVDFNLISLWPINSHNGPTNEFERNALEWVSIHPIRPYIDWTQVGRAPYFRAVYPDIAITEACVQCHNNHPESPRRDFKLNDVMGAVMVTFPLN